MPARMERPMAFFKVNLSQMCTKSLVLEEVLARTMSRDNGWMISCHCMRDPSVVSTYKLVDARRLRLALLADPIPKQNLIILQ